MNNEMIFPKTSGAGMAAQTDQASSFLWLLRCVLPASVTAFMALSNAALAQDTASGQIAQNRADGTAAANEEAINNGTNPTLLTTQAVVQFQYNEIDSNLDSDLLEFQYTQPIGDGNKAFRFTVPFANSPFDSAMDVGDISITFVDVFYLTEQNGAAYTAELFLDTANRSDNGYGQFALETSVFYAFFLKNGGIFAPAWVQTFGLEGGSSSGAKLNQTTFDFYYVPKLANPKYFMTFDPAIIHDWESDDTFGSLQVTMGMLTGRLFGGDSQVFIKPGVLFGGDAPADWSLQVGFKVLNF
jgi:hypothetical protein